MDCFRGRVNGLDAAGVPFCFQPQALDFPLGYAVLGCSCINKGLCPFLPHCVASFRAKSFFIKALPRLTIRLLGAFDLHFEDMGGTFEKTLMETYTNQTTGSISESTSQEVLSGVKRLLLRVRLVLILSLLQLSCLDKN